jgi:hypothetical protein
MISINNFKKDAYIAVISVAKSKNVVVFSFTYVRQQR